MTLFYDGNSFWVERKGAISGAVAHSESVLQVVTTQRLWLPFGL